MEKGKIFGEIEIVEDLVYDSSVRCKSISGELYAIPADVTSKN